jgi:D-lactate dehydrogenase
MKDHVVLINCARGELMKIEDLIEGIENQKIGALGLDCLEYEEGIVHQDLKIDIISNREMAYLRQFPNVVHTQHMAFYTDAAVKSMVYGSVEGICAMQKGLQIHSQLS